jgi:hypothetical protein
MQAQNCEPRKVLCFKLTFGQLPQGGWVKVNVAPQIQNHENCKELNGTLATYVEIVRFELLRQALVVSRHSQAA